MENSAWYHTMELADGVVTSGVFDHRELVGDYRLPESLEGRTCLDVATYDGFWAFEMERRGGEVTAVDLPRRLDRDWPPQIREVLAREDLDEPLGRNFRLARAALDSHVELCQTNVYRLNELGRTFDFVHVGDLLLHLRSPLDALQQVRDLTRGVAHIVDCFSPRLDPNSHTFEYVGGWDYTTWWLPSLSALGQMCLDAGFDDVELLRTYYTAPESGVSGEWRAILRAMHNG